MRFLHKLEQAMEVQSKEVWIVLAIKLKLLADEMTLLSVEVRTLYEANKVLSVATIEDLHNVLV
jgi:hypothetical protein